MSSMTATKPRQKWVALTIVAPAIVVLLGVVVLLARWLRETPAISDFIATYPGETHLPEWAPVGFPAWLAWQHFLNAFLLIIIIRSGLLIRSTKRPAAYWARKNSGILSTKGRPGKHSINHWLHFTLDWIWVANGFVFLALLFVSGQWVRIVPTGWDVFPHAISVGIQYLSLDWPADNGWVNYNALQLIAYCVTVFVAAPLAIASGIRLSPIWRNSWARLTKLYPIELARAIHFPVMLYFVLFIVVHVTLVLATGALRNLNHMYALRDDDSWVGFSFFVGSLALIVAAWVLARPMFLRPVAQLSGNISRG